MDRPRRDPTANTAIGNVMREQRRKRRRDATMKQDLNPCAKCGGTAANSALHELDQLVWGSQGDACDNVSTCRRSSTAEPLFRNQQAVGSNPIGGSNALRGV